MSHKVPSLSNVCGVVVSATWVQMLGWVFSGTFPFTFSFVTGEEFQVRFDVQLFSFVLCESPFRPFFVAWPFGRILSNSWVLSKTCLQNAGGFCGPRFLRSRHPFHESIHTVVYNVFALKSPVLGVTKIWCTCTRIILGLLQVVLHKSETVSTCQAQTNLFFKRWPHCVF